MTRFFLVSAFSLMIAGAAHAQSCPDSFLIEGTPMLTVVNYRAHQVFPGQSQAAAVQRLASAVSAEGFSGIRVQKGVGAVSAVQETSGSGRPQTLRVVARKSGKGVRVDALFSVQIGQMADTGATRAALCRIVSAAGD